MDDLKDMLGSADVPERDPGYWRDFAGRVRGSCGHGAAARPARRNSRMAAAVLAFAAAAAAVAAVMLLAGRQGNTGSPDREPAVPSVAPVGIAAPASKEAGRTARLAGLADAGALGVLAEAASEKVTDAERALRNRDIGALAPLARSYGKLLREGIGPGLAMAADAGEDVSVVARGMLDALASDSEVWKRISSGAGDAQASAEAQVACEAGSELKKMIEDEFVIGRQ